MECQGTEKECVVVNRVLEPGDRRDDSDVVGSGNPRSPNFGLFTDFFFWKTALTWSQLFVVGNVSNLITGDARNTGHIPH